MVIVAAFYKFTRFRDPAFYRGPLRDCAARHAVKGTILLATEGLNGTIAGARDDIDAVIEFIRGFPGCADLDWKESLATEIPFGRMKVRLKGEIVTIGEPGVDPVERVGTYVPPEDWNALLAQEDVAVIDTRNDYEVAIGTFEGAVDPGTTSFGEFPAWWRRNRDRFAGRKVAMFCTGGIRCEKASSFLLGEGVGEVFHLRGGILKYLEQIPPEESLWRGDCFVFDGRVSVGHGLSVGAHDLCHGCRRPLGPDDKMNPHYELGVSCGSCYAETSEDDRARFRERQRQIELAAARGILHLGS